MTPAELAAYRFLCQRWPESDVGAIDAYTDTACPESIRDWSIIGHLESLLGSFAYESPGWGDFLHRYRIAVCVSVPGPSRLSALIAACVAVLTAKGKSDA